MLKKSNCAYVTSWSQTFKTLIYVDKISDNILFTEATNSGKLSSMPYGATVTP